ncbi:capsular related protein, Esterase, SGNH hydrolase-type domain containing [Pseudohyphozyma bogoriensis]|nr:capsular related protein, Esterase, SGNH hydrolase-type domain containing [Pseudohyphozyma bogoriensis]
MVRRTSSSTALRISTVDQDAGQSSATLLSPTRATQGSSTITRRTSYSAIPVAPPSPLRKTHAPPSTPPKPSSPFPRRNRVLRALRYRPRFPSFVVLAALNILVLLYLVNLVRHLQPAPAVPSTTRDATVSLNTTTTLDPATQSCELCILEPEHPLCEYGMDNVRLSRMYEGSGVRVRKVLEKAMRGEQVRIGVIGASVTQGHGVPPDKPRWQDRFYQDFVTLFPNTTIVSAPVPGVTSWFFSYCFNALLPTDLDLYLVELDINNEAADKTYSEDDALFRGLLGLPQEPAVIRISVFALLFADLARGTVSTLVMSQYFDVPVVGIRNFLMPHSFIHPDETPKFFSLTMEGDMDTRHISWLGHQAMGDMLALYMRAQVCEVKRRSVAPPPPRNNVWPGEDILGRIPNQYIWKTYDPTTSIPAIHPSCALTSSELSPLVPIPTLTTGDWKMEEWNNKKALTSFTVGSTVAFNFVGTRVGIFTWTTNGKKNKEKPGRAKCWVDEEREKGVVVDVFITSEFATTGWTTIAEELKDGDHIVTCQLIPESSTEGHDFRILGIGSQ